MKEQVKTVQESTTSQDDQHAPRQLSVAENVILTIKVLVGFGVLGAALWGLTVWKAAS